AHFMPNSRGPAGCPIPARTLHDRSSNPTRSSASHRSAATPISVQRLVCEAGRLAVPREEKQKGRFASRLGTGWSFLPSAQQCLSCIHAIPLPLLLLTGMPRTHAASPILSARRGRNRPPHRGVGKSLHL